MDWKNPNYKEIIERRIFRLQKLREDPKKIPLVLAYYKNNIADFINDWGMTYDPRNIEIGLPASIPFILFERQREWIEWTVDRWKSQESGLSVKSRDMGLSWLSIGVACALCITHEGVAIGFGSRKEEYVDRIGSPKSLFWKARMFMEGLPVEFRAGFIRGVTDPKLILKFPEMSSTITGECGDGIGRGDRSSIYFVDESAFLERPKLTDASLSQTTNCRIDISTVNGTDNPFAEKLLSGRLNTFKFHWRDDPRKDQAWYDKQVQELDDPLIIAQEIDMDLFASKDGIVIPQKWVQAAIDAHEKLKIDVTGGKFGALDVADQGRDKNAFSYRHGILLKFLVSWSGKDDVDDIFETVEKSFLICDKLELKNFRYDADGLGSGVRGDSRVVNERRVTDGLSVISADPYKGSSGVLNPDGEMIKGRKNKDLFANFKAQSWWWLRGLFLNTYRAVNGKTYDPDRLISISSKLKELTALTTELSQVAYILRNGKIVIDKQPEGTKSPNLADSVMINYAPRDASLSDAIAAVRSQYRDRQ